MELNDHPYDGKQGRSKRATQTNNRKVLWYVPTPIGQPKFNAHGYVHDPADSKDANTTGYYRQGPYEELDEHLFRKEIAEHFEKEVVPHLNKWQYMAWFQSVKKEVIFNYRPDEGIRRMAQMYAEPDTYLVKKGKNKGQLRPCWEKWLDDFRHGEQRVKKLWHEFLKGFVRV